MLLTRSCSTTTSHQSRKSIVITAHAACSQVLPCMHAMQHRARQSHCCIKLYLPRPAAEGLARRPAAGVPSNCPLCGALQDLQHDPKHDRQLMMDCVAEITGAWHTEDPHILTALHQHHIWSETFTDTRLRWRPKQVITALELRCRRLQQPLVVQNNAKFWGCFSWCELETGASLAQLHDATPALNDRAFEKQQTAIREALQSIECTQASVLA